MIVMHVRNAQEALPRGLQLLRDGGRLETTRNGPAMVFPCPVVTITESPRERVIFHAERGANPFFHAVELCWMLAGRRDLAPLVRYVKRMTDYSDDGGVTQNAAYGWRLRNARCTSQGLHRDQLAEAIQLLRASPGTRQIVLQIWDHAYDLGTETRDHACNVAATLQAREGRLDMVVLCRSNDAIWGAHGANAVHLSGILEYVATWSGLEVGRMTQVSVNYHAYVSVMTPLVEKMGVKYDPSECPYRRDEVTPAPMICEGEDRERWDLDCRTLIDSVARDAGSDLVRKNYHSAWIRDTVTPIVRAHYNFTRVKSDSLGLAACDEIKSGDWRLACRQWIERRIARREVAR